MFVFLEGDGRNPFHLPAELRSIVFLSPHNYDHICSISLQNYDQICSTSLQNYDQGVQEVFFGGPKLLFKKTDLKKK